MTIPHYLDLSGLGYGNAKSWDALRESAGPYRFERDREAWLATTRRDDLRERAHAIRAIAEQVGARRIASYGVGTGALEQALAETATDHEIVCSDFSQVAVDRLASFTTDLEVVPLDLSTGGPLEAGLHLFHRIETEFDNSTWRRVFERFASEHVLMAGEYLQSWAAVRYALTFAVRRKGDRGGYLRNPAALQRLWGKTHREETVAVGNLPGFQLTPRLR